MAISGGGGGRLHVTLYFRTNKFLRDSERKNQRKNIKKGTIEFVVTETGIFSLVNPFMPTGAFNICCPRDAVSMTANVERTVRH